MTEAVSEYMHPNYIHEALGSSEFQSFPDGSAYFLNDLPEFSFTAQRSEQIARGIHQERLSLLREGQFDAVPMPIDMTGTARRYVEAVKTYGEASPRALIASQALDDDIDRQVGELESKMTWAYFEPITHVYSEEVGGFMAYDRLLRDITANGISPLLDDENSERAINDYNHQSLDEAFYKSAYAEDYVLFSVMECSDWAIDKLREDKQKGKQDGAYAGHVPQIEKIMIQCLSFDTDQGERELEQLAVPGTVIDRQVLHDALEVLGVVQADEYLTKTELHSKRIMVHKDVMSSVLDMQKLLDQLASERYEKSVFMGEVHNNPAIDYEAIPQEAMRRSNEYDWLKQKLRQKMISLEESGVDKWQTEQHVQHFIKEQLTEVVKTKPEEARKIFNNETADGLLRVQQLQNAGRLQEAIQLQSEVLEAAPMPSSCGAGSCGLQGVASGSSEDASLRKKLGADSSQTLVRDKERACRCGRKSVVYAFNKTRVTKYCESCGAFESKYSKA